MNQSATPGTEPLDRPVSEFDRAVRTVDVDATVSRAEVADGWDMGGFPNGGYLASIALDAMRRRAAPRSPVLVTAAYFAAARVGPAQVMTNLQHVGATHTSLSATLAQDQRDVAAVRAVFTSRPRDEPVAYLTAEAPDLPDPDSCVHPHPDLPVRFRPPAITARVELRLRPEHAGFAIGAPHGTAEMEGWARFADGRNPDLCSLPLFADAFPPPVFNAGLALDWVPTVELTVHLLRPPAPGWLRARFMTRQVSAGYLEEDGELWDADGHLVALSRQLALAPRTANQE